MLSALCRLARDWNDKGVSEEWRKRVQPFFLDHVEDVPRVGPHSGNTLRRRFILVALSHGTPQQIDSFERHIIRQWLIERPEVRSLYRLHTKNGSIQFHFWIDIVADPYETDGFLLELQRRCEDERIEIGTRSIDVMEQLLHESIEGIENTDFGEETCRFMQEMGGVELDVPVMFANDAFLFSWVASWDKQTASVDPEIAPSTCERLTKFYRCFFACNFAARPQDRAHYLREAANAWLMIYQDLESAGLQLLMKFLGATDRQEAEYRLKNHLPEPKRQAFAEIKGDWVRMLLEYMCTCNPEKKLPNHEDMKAVRRQSAELRAFRNDMSHEADPRKSEALYILGLQLEKREAAASRVTESTRTLIDILNAVLEGTISGPFGKSAGDANS